MKHVIELQGQLVEYTIRESTRARSLRMTISMDDGLVVSVPRFVPARVVDSFLKAKSSWILKHLKRLKSYEQKTIIRYSREEYERNKKQALLLVTTQVEFFNRLYKFPYKTISIRNQKTLWGSCSRRGNLQFNYKLVHLPKRLADYIIVHEICHLKEHNHSERFWQLVAQTIPDHKALRKELRQYMFHPA